MSKTKKRIEIERARDKADAVDDIFTVINEVDKDRSGRVPDPHYGDWLKKDF